jgi:serine/threonine protein kinase
VVSLTEGAVFAGYTIVRMLGSGGMGEVYLARHPRLPRHDAIKILPREWSTDVEYRSRFIREADLASTLWHPHIVGVHDRGEAVGQLWISMDFVDGVDASRLLESRYPAGMPVDEVVRIVSAVGSALDYAHRQGLLHRDVKPANIMLTHLDDAGEQRTLLTDFGIARHTDDVSGLTATNMTVGTVAYSAPEQLMGEDVDGRADQYALAATAYHLLTGRQLFAHSNPAVVISRHLNTAPPAVSAARPGLSALDQVLTSALAKDPKDRYSTCSDFARALADRSDPQSVDLTAPAAASVVTMRRPTPTAAAALEPATDITRSPRSKRMLAAVAAALVVALASAIAIWQPWRDDAAAPTADRSDAPSTSLSSGAASPPASSGEAPLGQAQTTTEGVKASAVALQNPTTRQPDADFARIEEARPWTVLDAELCAGTNKLTKTGYGFTLLDTEGREYKSYDSTLQPFAPTISGGDLAPGECARGVVNYEIPDGVRLAAVRWDYPGGGGPLRWTLDRGGAQSPATPRSAAAPVALPDQPPPNSGCPGTVSAQQDIDHPKLGPMRIFLLLDSVTVDAGCISAVTASGTALPPIPLDVQGGRMAFAQPATDTTGNTFITFNPGRYNGVLVLVPTDYGFADIDWKYETHYQGRLAYYYADLVGPGADGRYSIRQSSNDCNPSCADGTTTEEILTWNGSEYVR